MSRKSEHPPTNRQFSEKASAHDDANVTLEQSPQKLDDVQVPEIATTPNKPAISPKPVENTEEEPKVEEEK